VPRLALLVLLPLLVVSALGLVSAQHKSRQRFAQLEAERARAQSLEVEYGRLQLEQSTWAMHARIERIATERLRMRSPGPARTQIVPEAAK
jgi:cell division protein FtsL